MCCPVLSLSLAPTCTTDQPSKIETKTLDSSMEKLVDGQVRPEGGVGLGAFVLQARALVWATGNNQSFSTNLV